MKNDERREKIYDMLVREEKMSVNDIIRRVGDSPATIRRDLTFLEKNGYILRTHGYAKYIQPEIVHMKEFSADKIAIARAAVKLVEEGDALLLDSGFSTLALAYQMVGMKNLSIVTNSNPSRTFVFNAWRNTDLSDRRFSAGAGSRAGWKRSGGVCKPDSCF